MILYYFTIVIIKSQVISCMMQTELLMVPSFNLQ